MKIYLDLLLILNFFLDFILILSVSLILKRNSNLFHIIIGSFIGSFTVFLLFFKLNSIQLFLLKVAISIVMIIVSLGFKNLKYFLTNVLFLYINSIMLGGFIYFLNIQFSYKNEGLVFYYKGISINYIFVLIFSPIIIYIYSKQIRKLKNTYSLYYKTNIYVNSKIINCTGYLDTGNNLSDPITHKPIVLIKKELINTRIKNYMLVPYITVNGNGLIKCIKLKKLEVIGIGEFKNVLLGIIEGEFKFNGVDVILNNKLLEEKNDKKDC